jgi:cytochrome c
MTFSPKSATALAFVLVLAACGGGADQADDPAAAPTDAVIEAPAATPLPGETAVPGATPSETPAATPSPTASPSATATTAAAAPAGPPQAFAQCAACHKVAPGQNGIGPTLAGVFGAKAGHIAGFEYSQPMLDSGLTWNQATLDRYLENPRTVVPGTTMAFGGVKDAAKRSEIIAYLRGL